MDEEDYGYAQPAGARDHARSLAKRVEQYMAEYAIVLTDSEMSALAAAEGTLLSITRRLS